MYHPLDNPVHAALTGPHAHLARRCGNAVRYLERISSFCGLPAKPTRQDWADAARLVVPGEVIMFPALAPDDIPPEEWEVLGRGEGVQLIATAGLDARPDPEAIPLRAADVPDMLELVQRTKPGPFRPGTIELGGYLGIRRDGRLVAMAGQRVHPAGYTEISAVCTDREWRGHGFASRLTRAVAAGIQASGATPFLHAVASNTNAIRLYQALGFAHRRDVLFQRLRLAGHADMGVAVANHLN